MITRVLCMLFLVLCLSKRLDYAEDCTTIEGIRVYLLYVLYRVYVVTCLPKRPVLKNFMQESGSCRNLERLQLPVADLKGYDLIVRGVTALLLCLTKTQLPLLIINSLFTIAIQIMKYLLKFIRHSPYQFFSFFQ